jgi:ABC-2 type transport system permease protein
MNWRIISTLIGKDVALFFRNRLFAVITFLGLLAYVVIYYLMPGTTPDSFEIGLYAPGAPPALLAQMESEPMSVVQFESEAALREAILAGEYSAGVVLTQAAVSAISAGEAATVPIYFPPGSPADLNQAYVTLFRIAFNQMAYNLHGRPLNILVTEEILGPDMTGRPLPVRDRMLPLFAIILLLTETMGLAVLITDEVQQRTLNALLLTPMSVGGLFAGKGLTGVGLAFAQAALLMAITGGLRREPVLILVALLLGACLVTGISFLIASASRELMSVMGWGMLAMIVLTIPALGVALPGLVTGWVQIIPSYYLVDTVHQVVNFNAGWADVSRHLMILLATAVLSLGLGMIVLQRKFQ